MKTHTWIRACLTSLCLAGLGQAAPEVPVLPQKLPVTAEIKRAFHGSDRIEIREITGSAAKFQVGGTYRVVGICRQETLANGTLYVGNSAEPGGEAITAMAGSSLSKAITRGSTEFDITFTLLRPGILHVTLYDLENRDKNDNAYAGVYLGDVVFKH